MTPTADHLTEAISGAIATASQLGDDARWLYVEAYWPQGRDPDRPTRIALRRRNETGDGDHVPGERLALGVGNDHARAAYTASALKVADAHRLAGRAVAHYTGRRPPTGRVSPPRGREFHVMVDAVVRRLRWLTDHDIAGDRDPAAEKARRDAHAAAVALQAAHVEFKAVLRDDGGTKEPGADRRCLNCGDPISVGRRHKECDKCARYRQRTGRPRSIRRHEDARRARDRRRERGEDHAQNPPPLGDYIEGQWTPAVPRPDPEPRQEAS